MQPKVLMGTARGSRDDALRTLRGLLPRYEDHLAVGAGVRDLLYSAERNEDLQGRSPKRGWEVAQSFGTHDPYRE
jgi:hypothetical protein